MTATVSASHHYHHSGFNLVVFLSTEVARITPLLEIQRHFNNLMQLKVFFSFKPVFLQTIFNFFFSCTLCAPFLFLFALTSKFNVISVLIFWYSFIPKVLTSNTFFIHSDYSTNFLGTPWKAFSRSTKQRCSFPCFCRYSSNLLIMYKASIVYFSSMKLNYVSINSIIDRNLFQGLF